MSTDVISQPSVSHRGRRRSLLAVLAMVAVVGIAGAVTVARSSGGISGGHEIDEPPAVVARSNPECGVDVEYLAAEVGTMPETVRSRVIAELSLQMHQLLDRALVNQASIGNTALQYGFPYSPPVPDGPTLTRALAAIHAADARAIVSGLSPERRAEIGTSSLASQAGAVCP